jgi:hypothetical protein
MADRFTADESRKLAVLIARVWADPALAKEYENAPEAVLSGAGINLAGRSTPSIPERPGDLSNQMAGAGGGSSFSSASSVSCATCPCSGCTASCACAQEDFRPQIEAIMKLADSPDARAQARKMMAAWDIKLSIQP